MMFVVLWCLALWLGCLCLVLCGPGVGKNGKGNNGNGKNGKGNKGNGKNGDIFVIINILPNYLYYLKKNTGV